MTFISDILTQKIKTGQNVCGDHCVCERNEAGTVYVLADGIGSGAYANIAAIHCASRLTELIRGGMSARDAAELVARGMHRARTEDIPYSAFSAALIMPDGYFYVYSYEAPVPVLLTSAKAAALNARHYTAGYEVVAECEGRLHPGDALILMSDGVTQSGMGHGYGLGIGPDGVAEIINKETASHANGFDDALLHALPELVAEYCASLAEGRYEDDTTLALLHCRKAAELTLLTGPPSHAMLDKKFAELILNRDAGTKVVCGSTTLDIISRELNEKTEVIPGSASFGAPPEYKLKGVDLAVEGSVTLNQVCNIIDEPIELFEEENVVQRLCLMLRESDVIHLHIGMAANHAHESIFFKQVGVRLRRMSVERLTRKLRAMGKLVTENYY